MSKNASSQSRRTGVLYYFLIIAAVFSSDSTRSTDCSAVCWILRRNGCICGCVWSFCKGPTENPYNEAVFPLSIGITAYSLFTAAQFLRHWFSALTQTVTQTPKNQVELSVLETTKLQNFLSRKVRKCPDMSAKNIRPPFGTKRPRVRIPTLRPDPAEIFRFHPDFSVFSELFLMENSVTFPSDPNPTQTGKIRWN